MRVLVFLDGAVADPDAPQIAVDDLGLRRGDGVFETILVADGRPRELGPHLDRLERSAAMLDLPDPDRAAWEQAVGVVLRTWRLPGDFALRLVYTRGRERVEEPLGFALASEISAAHLRQRVNGIAAVTLDRGIDPAVVVRAPWLLLGAKSLSYGLNMAAIREANRRGADDVIFTTGDGAVLEGPTSSVVVAKDGTLYTPPATIGILPGTTQAALFRGAELAGWTTKVEPVSVSDLVDADGVFLTSSVRKVTRIHTLDGQRLPDSADLHRVLAAAYESGYA